MANTNTAGWLRDRKGGLQVSELASCFAYFERAIGGDDGDAC
jgi:hypothetical protein